eukprot:gnl/MRDRNA2_/MRDRNA2_101419_c0_seq1.p1 gnl/MRDRNA2_/MRDRNA2_101419_c0~~gnl/MRDRNA2_/MRDRNA2_101419_c0_seq1.p1  ORF type:complete len:563 (-),score=98.96 gnl/MRDRNA2_/MRDRNA2_101419_c0_seq1:89-1777(-)
MSDNADVIRDHAKTLTAWFTASPVKVMMPLLWLKGIDCQEVMKALLLETEVGVIVKRLAKTHKDDEVREIANQLVEQFQAQLSSVPADEVPFVQPASKDVARSVLAAGFANNNESIHSNVEGELPSMHHGQIWKKRVLRDNQSAPSVSGVGFARNKEKIQEMSQPNSIASTQSDAVGDSQVKKNKMTNMGTRVSTNEKGTEAFASNAKNEAVASNAKTEAVASSAKKLQKKTVKNDGKHQKKTQKNKKQGKTTQNNEKKTHRPEKRLNFKQGSFPGDKDSRRKTRWFLVVGYPHLGMNLKLQQAYSEDTLRERCDTNSLAKLEKAMANANIFQEVEEPTKSTTEGCREVSSKSAPQDPNRSSKCSASGIKTRRPIKVMKVIKAKSVTNVMKRDALQSCCSGKAPHATECSSAFKEWLVAQRGLSNASALEYARIFKNLLQKNGVATKCSEYTRTMINSTRCGSHIKVFVKLPQFLNKGVCSGIAEHSTVQAVQKSEAVTSKPPQLTSMSRKRKSTGNPTVESVPKEQNAGRLLESGDGKASPATECSTALVVGSQVKKLKMS